MTEVAENTMPSGLQTKPTVYSRDEHNVSRSNIDPDALKILQRLLRHGYKAYLVGGGVRDLLLGKQPKDFDITTDATPRMIKDLFRNSRIIGRRFKLVHVFFGGGKIIQVATFRDFSDPIDVDDDEESSLKKKILPNDNKYGTEVTDAHRRDLTINGLFYDLASFSIIDYVGGMEDLRAGIVRIIGDPDERFIEDPVRLIRVVRHAARSGFVIEASCRTAIDRRRELLKACSPMRIFEEVKKDLLSGSCLPIFRLLATTGLLEIMLPELIAHDHFLLSDKAVFAQALKNADQMLREGGSVSVTPLLALIALNSFFAYPEQEDPVLRFAGPDEIVDHVARCFPTLSVPRRERERVEELLIYWHDVRSHGEEADLEEISQSEVRHDLIAFARMLNLEGVHSSSVSLIADALRKKFPNRPPRERNVQTESRSENGNESGRRRRRRGGRGRSRRAPEAPRE